MMALTEYFKETIQAHAQRDSAFRKALLQDAVECLLAGDVDTGKAVLRDYINATIGFEEPSEVFDKSTKSLMRMFGSKGNTQASNLFAVIHYLQEQEGIHLEVKAGRWLRVLSRTVQSAIFSSILKDFLSMVFFMVLPFSRKISH
jgi:hypothetical protein